MSQEESNKAIIHYLARLLHYKGWIIGATVVSGIAAVIISLYVLKPYYQSFALVYPTNLTMHERAAMFSNSSSSGEDGGYYGTKHDANRILTVANSQWLIQRMIADFDLSAHYGFDKNTEYLSSKTTEQFMDQYQVYKTEEDAIRINYIDTDPVLAAQLVNEMVEIIDATITAPIQRNKESMYVEMKKQLDSSEVALNELAAQIQLNSDSAQNQLLTRQYEQQLFRVKEIQQLVDQHAVASSTYTPGLEVIESAYPAERKLKPVRWLICAITVLVTFILSCLLVLFFDALGQLRKAIKQYETTAS